MNPECCGKVDLRRCAPWGAPADWWRLSGWQDRRFRSAAALPTKPGACESAPPLLAVPARYRQTEAAPRAVNCLHEHGNMQGPHPVDLPLNLGVSKGQVHSSLQAHLPTRDRSQRTRGVSKGQVHSSPPPHKGQVAAYKGQVDSIVPTRDRSIYPNSGIAGAGRARVAAAGWGA
jgi:hypothetical protein